MTFYLNNGNCICSQYTESNLFAGNCEENKLRKYTKTITGVYIKFILNRALIIFHVYITFSLNMTFHFACVSS